MDLAGTFASGLSGGLAAVRARLDLYGVVLAGVVGLVWPGITALALLYVIAF